MAKTWISVPPSDIRIGDEISPGGDYVVVDIERNVKTDFGRVDYLFTTRNGQWQGAQRNNKVLVRR